MCHLVNRSQISHAVWCIAVADNQFTPISVYEKMEGFVEASDDLEEGEIADSDDESTPKPTSFPQVYERHSSSVSATRWCTIGISCI